jgi:hypothetical protein
MSLLTWNDCWAGGMRTGEAPLPSLIYLICHKLFPFHFLFLFTIFYLAMQAPSTGSGALRGCITCGEAFFLCAALSLLFFRSIRFLYLVMQAY